MTVAFRKMEPGDRRFVLDSWATSYRLSYQAGPIAVEDWFTVINPQLSKVLDRPGVTTTVAYDPDADAAVELDGFITADLTGFQQADGSGRLRWHDQPYVFYCFVKKDYRRRGIARALFRAAGIDLSKPFTFYCKTPVLSQLERQIQMGRFNPLPGRFPKETR